MSQRLHSEPELSVVIAVGDHEESIGHQIRNVGAHLTELGRPYEILVVNAGSQRQQPVDRQRAGRVDARAARARPRRRRARVPARRLGGARRRGRAAGRGQACARWRRWPGRCRASPRAATRSCCAAATWWPAASRRCRSSCAPAARAAVRGGVRTARAGAGHRHRRLAPAQPDAAAAAAGACASWPPELGAASRPWPRWASVGASARRCANLPTDVRR